MRKFFFLSFILAGSSFLLLADEDILSQLRASAGGMYTSFSGTFNYTSSSGVILNGQIYYKYPGNLHLKMSDGGIVATNGRFLWVYNPKSMRCLKQDVSGSSGGILGILKGYQGQKRGDTFVFKKNEARYKEIAVRVSDGTLRNVTLKTEEGMQVLSFSSLQVGVGIRASLFNFKPPPSTQVMENALNN